MSHRGWRDWRRDYRANNADSADTAKRAVSADDADPAVPGDDDADPITSVADAINGAIEAMDDDGPSGGDVTDADIDDVPDPDPADDPPECDVHGCPETAAIEAESTHYETAEFNYCRPHAKAKFAEFADLRLRTHHDD